MDKNKKIVAVGMGAIFLSIVAVFVFSISKYDPPKKEIKPELSLNMPKNNLDSNNQIIGNERDVSRNDEQINSDFVQPNNQNIANDDPNFGGLQARVINEKGIPVSGLVCKLFVATSEQPQPLVKKLLFDKKTDTNGRCLFDHLEAKRYYIVEFYNESGKNVSSLMLSYLLGGKTTFQNINVKQYLIDGWVYNCYDSDGGYRPFERGYVTSDSDSSRPQADDVCIGNNSVMEMVCDNNGFANGERTFECIHGCKDGVCINPGDIDTSCLDFTDNSSCIAVKKCMWIPDRSYLKGYCEPYDDAKYKRMQPPTY